MSSSMQMDHVLRLRHTPRALRSTPLGCIGTGTLEPLGREEGVISACVRECMDAWPGPQVAKSLREFFKRRRPTQDSRAGRAQEYRVGL